jgi:hypothetical protein
MEATLVPKGGQRAEGGEEARSHDAGARASGTVGETRYVPSCRIDLKGILGSGKL